VSLIDFNTPEIMEPENAKVDFANMELAKLIASALHRVYPNRNWYIHADCENQIIDVILADVTTRRGYCIHLVNKSLYEIEREAIYGAGEILERYNLARTLNFNRETVDALRRSITGEAIEA
jgi:hypothetical protein